MTLEYAIVDIETTGLGGTNGNKITEIALAIHNGHGVIKEYHTLVNPETKISGYVVGLTGIDETMVKNAPTFSDIAAEINDLTENRIFVAHNVSFDYNIIKSEFNRIGIVFKRKRLCTVRLSKQLFPGFRSYSLGNLCKHLNISITNRHRAKGDTDATVMLFERLLAIDKNETMLNHIKANSREITLPPLLSKEVYDTLPLVHGVYYFKNDKGQIIYIGKAKNIKQRVLGHFYHKSPHEIAICKETAHIDYVITGNELIALLLESAAIKKLLPKYNRAQKKTNTGYAIVAYENRNGIIQLGYVNARQSANPIFVCYSITESIAFLEMLCIKFNLCPKYTHLQQNVDSCSHFRISSCKGVCTAKEKTSVYNHRVKQAIDFAKGTRDNLIIIEKGRVKDEVAFILVKDGNYKGFGYFPEETVIKSQDDVLPWLQPQPDNNDVKKIVAQYIRKFPQNLFLTSLNKVYD